MKRVFFKILFCVDILAILFGSVGTALIRKYDFEAGTVTDGFGRMLVEAPGFLRSSGVDVWAGFGWSVVDLVGYGILILIAAELREKIWVKNR